MTSLCVSLSPHLSSCTKNCIAMESTGLHSGKTRGLAVWGFPGHSAGCCPLGKGRTTSVSSTGPEKRKETSRGSPWGFVVRSSCTGKASRGPSPWEFFDFSSSKSGRYWIVPLGTASEGVTVVATFFWWGSCSLERVKGPWLPAEF